MNFSRETEMTKGSTVSSVTPLQVGLLWHSLHSDNLGVTALTFSQIALVEAAALASQTSVEFVILHWKETGPPQVTKPNIKDGRFSLKQLLSKSDFFANVRRCDIILDISAGDSFADIYGAKRFAYNFVSKAFVLLSGTPLVLSPQTIGPFKNWWARLPATFFMRRASKVFSRDQLSTTYAKSLGISKVEEACDVAFVLPWTPNTLAPTKRVRIGLNVSGLLFSGGYTRNNAFGLKSDYASLVRRLISRLSQEPNVEIHLISHVISSSMPVEDDHATAALLAKEFPSIVLAPRFSDPMAAKTYISAMDFFSGARMHACIAAFSSGVPVVPMAYSRKFSGLFGSLGYEHVADCVQMDEDELLNVITNGFHERQELKKKVDAGNRIAARKLKVYQDYLEQLLRDRSQRS